MGFDATAVPRLPSDEIAAVDEALADISRSFDYLLVVTPVDAGETYEEFRASGFRAEPRFRYGPLAFDPAQIRRRLAAVPVGAVEDPDLARLFSAKQVEIERWLDFADLRGTAGFLPASIDLYGGADDGDLELAETVLAAIPRQDRARERGQVLGARSFAALCEDELDRYRADYPALPSQVTLRGGFPGVMVSGTDVIVGQDYRIPLLRAQALVHHEVGTHVVTAANGAAQPLRLLEVGLPGYEETQEGLAVLAECLGGGLTAPRLALLAARVIAVRRLLEEATFAQVFGELHTDIGLLPERAWDVTMRTFRAGGLTKDARYLPGFARVVEHLRDTGDLEALSVGKLALVDVPAVTRLRERGVLGDPPLRPHWFDDPPAAEWRRRLEESGTITQLAVHLPR